MTSRTIERTRDRRQGESRTLRRRRARRIACSVRLCRRISTAAGSLRDQHSPSRPPLHGQPSSCRWRPIRPRRRRFVPAGHAGAQERLGRAGLHILLSGTATPAAGTPRPSCVAASSGGDFGDERAQAVQHASRGGDSRGQGGGRPDRRSPSPRQLPNPRRLSRHGKTAHTPPPPFGTSVGGPLLPLWPDADGDGAAQADADAAGARRPSGARGAAGSTLRRWIDPFWEASGERRLIDLPAKTAERISFVDHDAIVILLNLLISFISFIFDSHHLLTDF